MNQRNTMERSNTMHQRKWLTCLLGCGAMALGGCAAEFDSVGGDQVGTEQAALTQPDCHSSHGHYVLEQTTNSCPAAAAVCYEGEITNGGIMNGDVHLTIWETVPLLPGSDAIGAYRGESQTTTNQGTLNMRHIGTFTSDSTMSEWLQADTSVVVGGTGRFLLATGHSWQTGLATPGAVGSPIVESIGELRGVVCLAE